MRDTPEVRLTREGRVTLAAYALAARVVTAEPSWLLRYTRSYPGRTDQVREVRAFLRDVLGGWPRTDDAVAIGSELAANCVLHSRSGEPGGAFTVRAEVSEGATFVSVLDDGGPWELAAIRPQAEHGLDLVQAIAGPTHWGVTTRQGGHLVWARLPWPGPPEGEPAALGSTTPLVVPPPPTAPQTAAPHIPAPQAPASQAAAIAPAADDPEKNWADLEELADALTAAGLPEAGLILEIPPGRLITPGGRLPYLEIRDVTRPELLYRVYAQAGWYFWPTAERIAATDDVPTAATTITRTVHAEAPSVTDTTS